MHEGFWFRASRPTGYKVMRCFPHLAYGPSPGSTTSYRLLRDPSCPTPSLLRRARCRQGWPANSGVCGEDTATASLDGSCARRIRAFAGRDEETAPGRTKKRAKARKEGRASHGTVTRTLDRRVRDEEFAARSEFPLE